MNVTGSLQPKDRFLDPLTLNQTIAILGRIITKNTRNWTDNQTDRFIQTYMRKILTKEEAVERIEEEQDASSLQPPASGQVCELRENELLGAFVLLLQGLLPLKPQTTPTQERQGGSRFLPASIYFHPKAQWTTHPSPPHIDQPAMLLPADYLFTIIKERIQNYYNNIREKDIGPRVSCLYSMIFSRTLFFMSGFLCLGEQKLCRLQLYCPSSFQAELEFMFDS